LGIRIAAAAVAVAATCSICVFVFYQIYPSERALAFPEGAPSTSGTVLPSTDELQLPIPGNSSTAGSAMNIIPIWYTPQELSVQSLRYANLAISEDFKIEGTIGMNYLHVTYDNEKYAYVDPESKTVVIVDDLLEPVIRASGIPELQGQYQIRTYSPVYQYAILCLYSPARTYFVDLASQTIKKTPIDGTIESIGLSPDGTQYVVRMFKNNASYVLLYDIATNETVDINRGAGGAQLHNLNDDVRSAYFSPTGRFIVYSALKPTGLFGHGVSGYWIIYDNQTKKGTPFYGEVDHFIENDEYLIGEDQSGIFKLRCDSGEKITITAENTEAYDYIRISVDYDPVRGASFLYAYNGLTQQYYSVSDGPVAPAWFSSSAYAFSEDRKYLYYYSGGADHIVCMDIATGLEFQIAIDIAFVDEVLLASYEEGGRSYYPEISLFYDDAKREILLCYQVKENFYQPSPDAPSNLLDHIDGWFAINLNLYLTASTEYFKKYNQYMDFYQGDGYLYCTITIPGQGALILVEDYRNNTWSKYKQTEGAGSSLKLVYSQPLFGDDGIWKTLADRGVVIKPAAIDYSTLALSEYADHTVNPSFLKNYDYLKLIIESYRFESSGISTIYYDLEPIYQMLQIVLLDPKDDTMSFTMTDEYFFYISYPNIPEGGLINVIMVGKVDGRPSIYYYGHLAYLSAEDYQWISELIKELDGKNRELYASLFGNPMRYYH